MISVMALSCDAGRVDNSERALARDALSLKSLAYNSTTGIIVLIRMSLMRAVPKAMPLRVVKFSGSSGLSLTFVFPLK